ncbi:hypothetical protein JOJ88_004710 [Pantoea cypripedii]|nr:hypothetical protein [Pantoea cypripedii]
MAQIIQYAAEIGKREQKIPRVVTFALSSPQQTFDGG